MKDHIWIPLALAWLFCQAICDSKNGCTDRTNQITNLKLILRLTSESITATTADECINLCCDKNSICNMAEFNLTANATNCFHAFCDPIDQCLEDNLDKFKEDIVTYQIGSKEGNQQPVNNSTNVSKLIHIASRTIKPRKGVDNDMESSNSSSNGGQPNITNTFAKLLSTDQQMISESYPRSTWTTLDILGNDSNVNTKETIKIDASFLEDSTITTDIPDWDTDKMKHIVPRKGASDNRPWTLFSTPASLPVTKLMDQHPRPPIPTKQMAQPRNHSLLADNVTELDSDPLTMASISYPHNSTQDNNLLTQSPTGLSSDMEQSVNQEPQKSNVKNVNNSSSKLPIELVVSGSFDLFSTSMTVSAENLEDLHLQQSIYLVVSLIIGFLILLLVIGMVLKHVYGVWERRHYQRMDFLIDGLYNTRSAV